MDDKKKYEPLFSKGFEHLNDSYQALQQQLAAIDHEKENKTIDKGHTFDFTPPGVRASDDSNMRYKKAKELTQKRSVIIAEYKAMMSKEIGGLDEKAQQTILGRYDYETSTNGFKNYAKADLQDVKGINKEDEISFDFMAANYFEKYQQPEIVIAGEKENIDVWSERYLNMLDSFDGNSAGNNMAVDKTIDDLEPDKD